MVGKAIQSVRKMNDVTQAELAPELHVDRSLLAKIETGKRKASKDVLKSVTIKFDDPELYFAAMYEVTGGAFPPWLDNIDLHHAAIALKTLKENREADEAIKAAPLYKRREEMTDSELKMIDRMLKELRESVHVGLLLMAATCRAFGFSWKEEWIEHNQLLGLNQ